MAKVITIAQQKGGAGKTSLAAHLGAHWARKGKRVALLDLDPQQSLSAWFAMRQDLGHDSGHLTLRPSSGWRATTEVRRLGEEADVILIDCPPHAETSGRVAIRSADLVVVPCQLSPMDIWASRPTLEMVEKEGRPALLVLNRVPPRGKLADELRARMAKDGLPLAKASLGNRMGFAASLMDGLGVSEAEPRSKAAREIAALATEILRKSG
ncbi:MAG: ParA family protein [Alphaproteobacteria bacterium]|nr:ParA family protein [Alphaproteobacteria bacterium]MDX5369290.1 ParA family protein [Alphaproteobacteria bacterium]MDX5463975.1 ParA family protein [Alphaproteobacteria bacterium]